MNEIVVYTTFSTNTTVISAQYKYIFIYFGLFPIISNILIVFVAYFYNINSDGVGSRLYAIVDW